jgi:pyruvate kinase
VLKQGSFNHNQKNSTAMSKPLTRQRQTKILATLGPASNTEEMIEKLFLAGVDNFRLNFSHGSHEDHASRVKMIRNIEARHGRAIGIVADLQGPKLRVGRFKNGSIELTKGMVIRLDLDKTEGDEKRVNLPHPEIIMSLDVGAMILCDDGKVRMKIVDKGADYLMAEVIAGVKLSNNKGVNVPGVVLPIPALTQKDLIDMEAALSMDVDWIAQSFVQRVEDVAEARKLINGRAALMAKIEKPSAIENFTAILDHVDGIMLARGDLGVEIPAEDVPSVQKKVVREVRYAGKPIIVATQMLESMIESPSPTRAEASDVATAVYDGADAVMLSAETASGHYPLEAVSIMDRICQRVEADTYYRGIMDSSHPESKDDSSDAITIAACEVAHTMKAACITSYTSSGSTALRTARQRPAMPILCLSHSLATTRRLMLSYGIHAIYTEDKRTFDDAVATAVKKAEEIGLAKKGQRIVMTAGVPFGTPGSTNILRVAWVE